jgi:hypothetical protein
LQPVPGFQEVIVPELVRGLELLFPHGQAFLAKDEIFSFSVTQGSHHG